MTRFIALLAIVSGLLLYGSPSKADDTAEWCTHKKEDAVTIIKKFMDGGFPVFALDELATQSYLQFAYENYVVGAKPSLPGVVMVVIELQGQRGISYFFKGEKACGSLQLPWAAHLAAKNFANGD